MKTRVSVVVPCYNEERHLEGCLRSLAAQTVPPYEVIVVDNNSTDNSVKIAKSHGAKVVHEKRQGIAHARNAGFDAAAGDIIARIDADSVADKGWIEAIITAMNDKTMMTIGGVSYTYELRKVRPLAYAIHRWFNHMHEQRLSGLMVLYGFNQALRKTAWERIAKKLGPAVINEDIEFSIAARELGGVRRVENMIVGNRLTGFLHPRKLWRYWRADGRMAKQLRKEAKR